MLNEEQKSRAIAALREYMSTGPNSDGKTAVQVGEDLDRNRRALIASTLLPLCKRFIDGAETLETFKHDVDSINKKNELWGFRGIKGQMFFNQLVNVAEDREELIQELRVAIVAPENDLIAASRIRTFMSFVRRLGEQWVESGNSGHGKPRASSVPFFLSYFWQIQNAAAWPIYYTNSIKTMQKLHLWQATNEEPDDYVLYRQLHEELIDIFANASGDQSFDLYKVEHVFWFKGENPWNVSKPDGEPIQKRIIDEAKEEKVEPDSLPDSYIPPIVSVLPNIARGDSRLVEFAKSAGVSLAVTFERHVNAAFTILGYETRLLGQGQGRVPDGVATSSDDSYAILWDSKIRGTGYDMGTDDRVIKEYITRQSREFKRKKSLRNLYYAIISSTFLDDQDDLIRSLKMETDVNEVILIEAGALVAMVDIKLRDPLQVSLGPDGLQRLYSSSGILTDQDVHELFN